jgi:hypothetical protein
VRVSATAGLIVAVLSLGALSLPAARASTQVPSKLRLPAGADNAPARSSSDLASQLVPTDSAITIALELETRGYALPVWPSSAGALNIRWYSGRLSPSWIAAHHPTTLVSGRAGFGRSHPSDVVLRATRFGRRLVERSRTLMVTTIAVFRSSAGQVMQASTTFSLR